MDPVLAELYGTNQVDESDVEKLAAAQMAEELADDGEIDTDSMTDDAIEALAQEVLGASESEEPQAEVAEGGEEMSEKVAEADYMGRVMAHAYVQELNGIEKEAGRIGDALESIGRRVTPKKLISHLKSRGQNQARASDIEAFKKGIIPAEEVGSHAKHTLDTKKLHRYAGGAAVGTGAAAVAGGAAGAHHLLKKDKKKHASAEEVIESAAQERALEMLDEAGYDVSEITKEAGRVSTWVADKVKPFVKRHATKSRTEKAVDAVKRGATKAKDTAKKGAEGAWKHRGTIGGAAALGLGGAAVHKMNKEKKGSALDTLAEQRALEILAENGIEIEETEKTAGNEYDVLADAINARAIEMLDEAGYIDHDEAE
jgi:hypothetical protein